VANGFSSFKDDHHYASGMILVLVGVVVAIGGATGTLAAALAALWTTPSDSLYETAGGGTPATDTVGNSPLAGGAPGSSTIIPGF
jgi:hypothetical protein